ncbi:ATP-binding cassette sub-family B member 9 isoform X1 [Mauremys reevesii]|uniref:ATP-binding cassette sub-family B member 9 isoform X1 n=1 Tax=Mauremys reevesii TaxID=260615 RepID=UPI00193FCA27|nr:ATP-binding cassette sub-family B member 9 isoform X1 [Mauremys reevesii]XP_039361346.1 ATP-binding cassette sub-family B member 9 isoform X1 [Mauremys reevesii]XP_039361347.1 ATP-binding cassette sub-family B member 9 isoform X1 [Mauremys reevesii]XP_039361349.1 ATP-binding cassette sub-family B member 9 isoform X1 [Mauremys reevesii]
MKMRVWKAVACTLAFTGVDVLVTTLLYVHSRSGKDIVQDLKHFNVFNSMLDVWGACLYRSCLLLGAAIGVAKNSTSGPQRLKASQTFITLVCLLVGIYALVKLLLYSEVRKTIRDPWFWSLFAWTYVSLAATFCLWQLLSSVTSSREALGVSSESRAEAEEICDPSPVTVQEKREEASRATIHKLLSYTKPDALFLGIATFFLLVAALGETFLPYYTGLAIDGIVIQKSMDQFSTAVVIMSLLAIGSSFAAGIRGGVFTLIFARLNIRLRNCLFKSLVAQETSFFDENRTGDIISRLTSDTTIVSDLVSQNINIFLRNVVKATGVIVFMFSLSWQLSLVTFMGFPIIMLVSDLYGKYYKKLSKEVQNALAKANNTAEETISAMKTVRSFASEDMEANVYWEKLQQVYKLNKKEALAYTYYVWSSGLTLLVVQVSILYYGGHLVISGQMTSGNLISFIIYEFVLGDCMESVGSVYSGLMQGVGAAEKVFEFIDRKPTMVNDGTLAPDHVEGKVEFRNVTFSYATRSATQVLQNVSFTLYPGKVTALVGPSGSGKSSCVNILENFYPLQDGQVLLDGQPINMYDHKYLHSVISLVSQEPVLFARSIAENISYGLTSVSFESVVQAAQKANAHAFITELQDGYNTEAGEKGAQLSGGQKQRVAIARALIRAPPILILDEATSALDAESEHTIQQAIYGDLQNHTVLVIAHRLSTVEKAHNIIVLDKGRVVQQGVHKELMEEGGLYSKLVQRQILGLETGTGAGYHLETSLAAASGDSMKPPGGLDEEFRV